MADTRFTVLLKASAIGMEVAGEEVSEVLVTLYLDADGGANLAAPDRPDLVGEIAFRAAYNGRWGVPLDLREIDREHPGVGGPR